MVRWSPLSLRPASLVAWGLCLVLVLGAAAPAVEVSPSVSDYDGEELGPPREGRVPLPAQRIHQGAVAREQIVGLGRDVVVEGEALADVAALNGSVEVAGTVRGDVIVLGGGVKLRSTARVEGQVLALGGRIEAAPGASIGGRAVAYPSISAAWLTLIEGPALGLEAFSPLVLTTKLALLAAWMGLTLLLFAVAARPLLATADAVREEPIRSFWIGLGGVVTLVLTALFVSAFVGSLIGLPWVLLVAFFLLLAKLWGMAAVFYAAGAWCYRRFHRRPTLLHAASVGLLVLGLLKLVPHLGVWVWSIATLIGVGATFTTKFGRHEPWFDREEFQASELAVLLERRG